jgi:hypothetical protein
MRPMTVDKMLLDAMIQIHSEFPVLSESDLLSIIDLLTSDDPEVQVTGITLLDTFNYFKTPNVISTMYNNTLITKEIDELDQFAMMVRMNYAYSKVNKLSEEEKLYDDKLTQICVNKFQEKD